ncbi:MAG: AbrB/MazE/SpoVT family DNA-binding domain-containing protein [Nanoarchaeota archaeon]
MKRKINAVGTGTLTVSLPSKWAQRLGIKKGDEVDVEEQGDALIIGGRATTQKKTADLSVTGGNWFYIRSLLNSMYRGGVDEVNVTVSSPELMMEVQKAVSGGLAYEFFQLDERTALVKNIVAAFDLDIPKMMQKMVHITNTLHQLTVTSMKSGVFDQYDYVQTLRHSLLGYRNIICRILLTNRLFDNKNFSYYNIVFPIANIGGQYRRMYERNKDHPKRHSPAEITFADDMLQYFNDTVGRKKPNKYLHEHFYKLSDEVMRLLDKNNTNKQTLANELMILRYIQSTTSHFMLLEMS